MAIRKIGSLWKAKEGQKAVLTGTIELLGEELRIGVYRNEKAEGNQPPYNIVRFTDDPNREPAPEQQSDF